jgi:diguanylate cyclase (GGDEF)-like protein
MAVGDRAGTAGPIPFDEGSSDRLLADITLVLVSEGALTRVLDAIADALREIVPYQTLRLYRADLPMRVLRPVLVRDRWSEEILATGPFAFGQGIVGWTAETGRPQMVADVWHDPHAVRIEGRPEGRETAVSVPLTARGELKGVLCLQRRGAGAAFDDEEFRRAVRFAGVAALAIDNAEIRERLEAEVVTDHLTALYNHRHFHERMAAELRRASMTRSRVSLVLYDIDDFSRVNASFGHLAGDQVLQAIAGASREVCREDDIACRVGGEEFAIIMPGRTADEAADVADRLRKLVATVATTDGRRVTVSAGVAEGPAQATAARDLVACADAALREAKALGKDRVAVWSHPTRADGGLDAPGRTGSHIGYGVPAARPADLALGDEMRSVAVLKMLQSLTQKLNRLNDIEEIGETITAELRSLIDYHNCRVHLLQPDGETLLPVAFRGELLEYQGETFDALVTRMGEGITGRVAESGEPFYSPNATLCDFSVLLPGTIDIDESILCVPMRYADRVSGTVTLSKLGIDQFDGSDLRLLELLASHAAVAFENARLFQNERESAEVSGALLTLSQALTLARDAGSIWQQALAAIPGLIRSAAVDAWVREPNGRFRMAAHLGYPEELHEELAAMSVPAELVDPLFRSTTEPFVMPPSSLRKLPKRYRTFNPPRATLVAPVHWEPDGLGAIAVVGLEPRHRFTAREIRLAKGIADIASLAMGNAERYAELERTYLSTIEALANALEAQDEYTSDHARALAEMALTVGGQLGLEGEDLKRLEISALFHDIGKIGVPSEIIRKPGPLTAEERRIMNRHPEIGEEILAPVPFLQPIRPIVRACHERWDGKGYPDGLGGEDIPVEARIVFVCDAFHAMTTDRPYRDALPESEAIRRMKLASGTQFDPAVVLAFVGLHRAGRIHFHRH